MGLKISHWSCLKACFKAHPFCFTTYLVRPSTGAQQSHERALKIRSNDLERSKFRQQVQSYVRVHPCKSVTFKLSILYYLYYYIIVTSEVTLVPKCICFLTILLFFDHTKITRMLYCRFWLLDFYCFDLCVSLR
jgi:hypothetical protein